MNNAQALRTGAAKAKQIIKDGIMVRLDNLLYDVISDLERRMMSETGGMTGNTWTSPAGATYADGVINEIMLGDEPLMGKLRQGMKFHAGRERFDGTIQERTFTADTDTSGNESRKDKYRFLESQQSGKGFKMTITGGTEYLGHQQLADNYVYCQGRTSDLFK